MSKKIALFFDGTWNTRASNTNVSKLYNLTTSKRSFKRGLIFKSSLIETSSDTKINQVKYYHDGVGVRGLDKIFGGAFGCGLSKNIREGYLWLAKNYQPGDDIYLFGFSRGAYTARSLVGLIRKCGIIKTPLESLTQEAYKIYREKKWHPDGLEAEAFRKTYSHQNVTIKFIGVWDTVGALGIPLHGVLFGEDYFNWHDTELSKIVKNAYHALALDEHRSSFSATMWTKPPKNKKGQTVEQRWFAGAHSDVGGGYLNGTLSNIPLRWIQAKAQECGLVFSEDVIVNKNDYLAKMHDSYGSFLLGLYKKLRGVFPYHRPFFWGFNETIDESVWMRFNSDKGKDEKGRKYNPPALKNIKNGEEKI